MEDNLITETNIDSIDYYLDQKPVIEALSFWISTHFSQQELIEALKYRSGEYTQGPVTLRQKEGKITEDKPLNKGYFEYQEKKSSGGMRTITIPCDPLKSLQANADKQLKKIPISLAAFGGEAGKSPERNIAVHKDTINKYLYITDIKDFFPSVSAERIQKNIKKSLEKTFLFSFPYLKEGQRDYFCKILTDLLTHNNELPQGSPCSTSIANIVLAMLDSQILSFLHDPRSNLYRPRYTRYIDDITVSRDMYLDSYGVVEELESLEGKIMAYSKPDIHPDALHNVSRLCKEVFSKEYILHDKETKDIFLSHRKTIRNDIEYLRDRSDQRPEYYTLINQLDSHVSEKISKKAIIGTAKHIQHQIENIITHHGRRYNHKKTSIKTPYSPGIREITGYTITDAGVIGISREKMDKYMEFIRVIDESPHLLPPAYKHFVDINEFTLNIPKILQSIKGIKRFVETHREHIPAKFMKHYSSVIEKYDRPENVLPDDLPF